MTYKPVFCGLSCVGAFYRFVGLTLAYLSSGSMVRLMIDPLDVIVSIHSLLAMVGMLDSEEPLLSPKYYLLAQYLSYVRGFWASCESGLFSSLESYIR